MNTSDDEKDRTEENKIQFLKYTITYLDNRVHLIDTKASLLIAIQGVFIGLLTFIFKQIFPKNYTSSFKTVGYLIVGVALFFLVSAIISLLMTIRPTRSLLSLRVKMLCDKKLRRNHVMWPLEIDGFPKKESDYTKRIDTLDFEDIERNYKRTHFVLLQLIRMKYEYYRCSMLLMKISILWSAIGFGITVILKALGL
jgi:hypothetical protein